MPVWVYSGKDDTVVVQGVVDHTAQFYREHGANVEYVNDHKAEHVFPTNLSVNKNTCMDVKSPYISNCGFDGVESMWKHIMPN